MQCYIFHVFTPKKIKKVKMHIEHKYCSCGFPIRVSHFWNGMNSIPVFRTETDFEKITHCPNCEEPLREKTLFELGALDIDL